MTVGGGGGGEDTPSFFSFTVERRCEAEEPAERAASAVPVPSVESSRWPPLMRLDVVDEDCGWSRGSEWVRASLRADSARGCGGFFASMGGVGLALGTSTVG